MKSKPWRSMALSLAVHVALPIDHAVAQSQDAAQWGGQHMSEALEAIFPLPELLPSERWRSPAIEWRTALQVVPPWTAPCSGTPWNGAT